MRPPGPTSNARWMSKGSYSLKLFIFRDQLELTQDDLRNLRDTCIFIIHVYLKSLYRCTSAISAPNQDLIFIKSVNAFKKINAHTATEVLEKISRHLWYLAPEFVIFALFDGEVSHDEKRNMVKNLDRDKPIVRLINSHETKDINSVLYKNLSDFVSKDSMFVFELFNLPSDFLNVDVSLWESNAKFKECYETLSKINVVNDGAERAVRIAIEYNGRITKNEQQLQYLLVGSDIYKKKFPDCRKSTLLKPKK